MSYIPRIFLAAWVFGLVSADAIAEPAPCPTCDKPKELTMREQIKAERERYQRENVQNPTTRPWDGMHLGRVDQDKKLNAN
jgi:hypothetical protein